MAPPIRSGSAQDRETGRSRLVAPTCVWPGAAASPLWAATSFGLWAHTALPLA